MRRILCCFLCLAALLATCSYVFAEGIPFVSFRKAVSAFFQNFDPEKESMRLTVEQLKGDSFSGTLGMEDGMLALQADLPGGPAALQIGNEAAWFSANGTVYELRYADFTKRPASQGNDSLQVWGEIAGLFGSRVLLPGIRTEQAEDTLAIRLSYTAETLLPALAEFGDAAVGSDRYLGAILYLLNIYARSTGQDELTAEAVRAAWPEAREMLLALPKDASLDGDIRIGSALAEGTITLSASGTPVTLAFSGSSDRLLRFDGSVSVSGAETASLHLLVNSRKGDFSLTAALPARLNELRAEGSLRSGLLRGEAELIRFGESFLNVHLTSTSVREYGEPAGSGQLVVRPGRVHFPGWGTVVAEYDFAPSRFQASCSANGRTSSFRWNRDEAGNFSASLEVPALTLQANLSGFRRHNAFSMHYALTKQGQRVSGSLSGSRSGDRFNPLASLTGTLNLSKQNRTVSLQFTRMGDDLRLAVHDGKSQLTASLAPGGSLKIRQTGRDSLERSVTGGFDEKDDYLLDYAIISRPIGMPLRTAESHTLLRVSAGGGNKLSITLTERSLRHKPDGSIQEEEAPVQHFAAALSRIPAKPAEPLSGQETIRITPEQLIAFLREAAQ